MTKSAHLKRTFISTRPSHPHVIILVQHGDDGSLLQKTHPEIFRAIPETKHTIQTYLNIEQDFGTPELAHAIAQKLKNSSRVDVIEIRYPRAIIDANRIEKHMIRDIFTEKGRIEFKSLLQKIYKTSMAEIDDTFHELDASKNDIFLSVHSMAPFSPKNSQQHATGGLVITPHTIKKYISSYTEPSNRGVRRPICLNTTLHGQPSEKMLADKQLVALLQTQLDLIFLPNRQDDPYPTSDFATSATYMLEYPGASIDVPKDFISIGSVDNPKWDLAHLQIDSNKIEILSTAIATAIKKRFS